MKRFTILLALLIGIPFMLFGQVINGRFSSSIYTFERFDSLDASNTHLRAYQALSLNINKSNYSLRTYLNLENDFLEPAESDPRLRFYNLYFEARNIFNLATLKVGRQPVFNNIGGGVFDGAQLDLKYDGYKLSGYYGGNVPAYQKLELTDNWEDNYIYGGRFTVSALRNFIVALAYVNKNFKRDDYYATRFDENFNPITTLIQTQSNQFSFASAQVSYQMENIFSADARYDYDFNYEKSSKIEFNTRYEQIRNLGINFYYNYREPRIRYNSIFSVFDFGNSQEIEAGADYKIGMFTAIGKFGYVKYKSDNSQRFSVGVNTNFGSVIYRKSLGYAGELDAVSLYTAHSFMEGFVTPSLGLSFTSYKLSADDEVNDLMSLLAGVNVRPWRVLSFDVQGQYLNNKIYSNDFRLFFKINYWFNTNLNLM